MKKKQINIFFKTENTVNDIDFMIEEWYKPQNSQYF